MATITLCDDCGNDLTYENKINILTPHKFPLKSLDLCNDCFPKHWKPLRKKFSLKKKN